MAPRTQLEHWIVQQAQQHGLECSGLMAPPGHAEHSVLTSRCAGVEQQLLADLIRELRQLTNDDFLGMIGSPIPYGSADIVIRSLIGARTLDEFLLALVPSSELIYSSAGIHGVFSRQRDICTLTLSCKQATGMEEVFPVYGLMAIHRGLCWLTDRHIRLQSVELTSGQPVLETDVQTIFDCPARISSDRNAISFAAQFLHAEIRRSLDDIHAYLRRRPLDILYVPGADGGILDRVCNVMRKVMVEAQRLPSFTEAARALNMSEATLRRKLIDEGSGWRILHERMRKERAEYLLRNTLHSCEDIAQELGFREVNSFFRAFRRWYGTSPNLFRRGPDGPN